MTPKYHKQEILALWIGRTGKFCLHFLIVIGDLETKSSFRGKESECNIIGLHPYFKYGKTNITQIYGLSPVPLVASVINASCYFIFNIKISLVELAHGAPKLTVIRSYRGVFRPTVGDEDHHLLRARHSVNGWSERRLVAVCHFLHNLCWKRKQKLHEL